MLAAVSTATIADRDLLATSSAATSENAEGTAVSGTIPPTSFLANLVNMDLLDQNGNNFDVKKLQGKTVLFNFIFTHCGSICPMQTKVLAETMNEIPESVRSQTEFVSISIDPVNDTPEVLKTFSTSLKANFRNWQFLTGDSAQIDALTQRLLIFDKGEQNKPQVHRTSLWLVDKKGRMLQRYRGDPPDKARLVRELNQISRITIQ